MERRFKIGILLTIGIFLLIGTFWATPASADHVSSVTATSQSTKNTDTNSSNAHQADSSSTTANKQSAASIDTKVSKANQSASSQSSSSQSAADANSSSKANAASEPGSPASVDNEAQPTTTVTVPVVNNDQQSVSQSAATTQVSKTPAAAKSPKQVTLTTPNSQKMIKQQSFDQISLFPRTSKVSTTLFISSGIISLAWVPALTIFNILIS